MLLFTTDASGFWSYSESLDKKSAASTTSSSKQSGAFSAARSMWESKVDRGQSSAATSGDRGALTTKHESAITYLAPYAQTATGSITEFTSTALDGRIVFWNLSLLNLDMVKLKI